MGIETLDIVEINRKFAPCYSDTKVKVFGDETKNAGYAELLGPLAEFKELPSARYSLANIS